MLEALTLKECNEPIQTANVVYPIISEHIKKRILASPTCKYHLETTEKQALIRLFNNHINFVPTEKHDHPVLHFVTAQLRRSVICAVKKAVAILVIGSTFREVLRLVSDLPGTEVFAICLKLDARDSQRRVQDVLKAKSVFRSGGKAAVLAQEFIAFHNAGDHGDTPHFMTQFSWPQRRNLNVDYCISFDAFYDIPQAEFAAIMTHFSCLQSYNVGLFPHDMVVRGGFSDIDLEIVFEQRGSKIFMRHKSYSIGYANDSRTYLRWLRHSLHKFESVGLLTEIVSNYSVAALATFTIVDRLDFCSERTLLHASNPVLVLFDIMKYCETGKKERFMVEKQKYIQLLDYCTRLSMDTYEPHRIIAFCAGLKSEIRLVMSVIQTSWKVEIHDSMVMLEFVMVHAALLRGRFWKAIASGVNISKKGGHKVSELTQWINRAKNFLDQKESRSLLLEIERAMQTQDSWVEENVQDSDKLDLQIAPLAFAPIVQPPKPKKKKLRVKLENDGKEASSEPRSRHKVFEFSEISTSASILVTNTVSSNESDGDGSASAPRSREIPFEFSEIEVTEDELTNAAVLKVFENLVPQQFPASGVLPKPIVNSANLLVMPGDAAKLKQVVGEAQCPYGSKLQVVVEEMLKRPDREALCKWAKGKTEDAVLLTNAATKLAQIFATLKMPKIERILDLGAAPGAMGLFAVRQTKAKFIAQSSFTGPRSLQYKYQSKDFPVGVVLDRLEYATDSPYALQDLRKKAFAIELVDRFETTLFDCVIADAAIAPWLSSADDKRALLNNQMYLAHMLLNSAGLLIMKGFGPNFEVKFLQALCDHFAVVNVVRPKNCGPFSFERYFVCSEPVEATHRSIADICSKISTINEVQYQLAVQLFREFDGKTIKEQLRKEMPLPAPAGSQLAKIEKMAIDVVDTFPTHRERPTGNFTMPIVEARVILQQLFNQYFDVSNRSDNAFAKLHTEIKEKLKNKLNIPDNFVWPKVQLLQGAPGCGKTWHILRYWQQQDIYSCPSGALLAKFREDYTKKYGNGNQLQAMTWEVAITAKHSGATAIFIDECYCHPIAYYIAWFVLAPHADFYLLGDPDQTEYLDEWGTLPANLQLSRYAHYFTDVRISNKTWRFGTSICELLLHFKKKVVPMTTRETSITVSDVEGRIKDADLNICFSNKTLLFITEGKFVHSAMTVKSAQGSEGSKVNLWVNKGDMRMLQNYQLVTVALSRAQTHLNVVEIVPKILNTVPEGRWIMECLRTAAGFIPDPQEEFMEIKDFTNVEVPLPVPEPRFTGEAAILRRQFDKTTLQNCIPDEKYDNYESAHVISGDTWDKSYKMAMSKMNNSTHAKLHKVLSTAQYGKQYRATNSIMTLFSSLKRQKTASFRLDDVHLKQASDFVRKFKAMYLKEDVCFRNERMLLSEGLISIARKYTSASAIPHIEPTLTAQLNFIKEFLKTIDKTKDVPSALNDKAGQPIKGWNRELNMLFCAHFRQVEKLFLQHLKDEFIYANSKSEKEVEELLNQFDGWVAALCCDFIEFDSTQSLFTQSIEKLLLEFFYDGEKVAPLYFEFRRQMFTRGQWFSYMHRSTKTSGEPSTLFTNSILAMALISMMLHPKDVVAGAFKGDDSMILLKTRDARPIEVFTSPLTKVLPFRPKLFQTETPEFCGHIYFAGCFFYDYVKLSKKILQKDFWKIATELEARKLFLEYQIACRDKLKSWYNNRASVNGGLASFYNLEIATIQTMMEQLEHFANCSWTRFKRQLEIVWTDGTEKAPSLPEVLLKPNLV
jgi:23S rRNA U2552 (ribose-2'-O)-methylase RlmE/FtsJ